MSLFSIDPAESPFDLFCDEIGCENNVPAWPDQFGRAVSQWLGEHQIPGIKTLSLFSGAGGLDIGFSDAGFDIVASVEIERRFCDTLERNTGAGKQFRNTKVCCTDIRNFSGAVFGEIDFIVGGPPCQPFSSAGRRANGVAGTGDERGVLFREYARLLGELSPKGFLFENVYGIIGAQGGKAWDEIKETFSRMGYRLFYRILDAADYGVPQHRERLFVVGLKKGEFLFPRPTHGPDSPNEAPFYNAGTAVEGVVQNGPEEQERVKGRYAALLDGIPPGLNYSFYTEEMGHPTPVFAWRSKFSDFLYKADPDAPVRTIKAVGGAYTGPLHWDNRFFTYEEYKRLQTFPDNYQISGRKQIAVKQIGNSVPPQLGRILALAIRQQAFGTAFPVQFPLLARGEELTFRKRKRERTQKYQKKAREAIEALKQSPKRLPQSRQYFCSIDRCFSFQEVGEREADYRVDIVWGRSLDISVSDLQGPSDLAAEIVIKPRKDWTLAVPVVRLAVYAKEELAYPAAWKAFEAELATNKIKADLVQLNGYYQYRPNLLCRFSAYGNAPYDSLLKKVVEGNGTAKILTTEELSKIWELPSSAVMEGAEYLKRIGYEVRNHFTNPQIERGSWLIPYAFPTLNPLSVQLQKKLR